jgi:pyrimidine-nucleoside phosphorylase
MRSSPAWIIQKKRDGKELTETEIREFVTGVVSGEVADYQATALLMAIFFRGMSLDETVALTQAMLESGERYTLNEVPGPKVDKHSTGGVGDKVSLILAPLAAACGLRVPMMSGRGLGHTGGTLDKLESIPGFSTALDRERFGQVLSKVGCAMIGQSARVAPADRKLYALRDVTGTVECVPLIVASILSKKLAEGTGALVLDVKVGNGAFMKTRAKAAQLAKALIRVSERMGVPCRALLTDMSQPLGYTVGNALEIREVIEILRNAGEAGTSCDLKEVTLALCAQMLELGGKARGAAQGRKLAREKLDDGSAWRSFRELVREQGGSVDAVDDPDRLARAPRQLVYASPRKGHVGRMDTEALGRLLVELGGGRMKATDTVDPAVGLVFHRKLGARVEVGEPLVTVHHQDAHDPERLRLQLGRSIEITRIRKPVPKLIIATVGGQLS